ncbi:hypothetical protein FB45DRAFT_1039152 [Roridomyces roridus]|uniref:Uncharacterized protein n=1 Tax=Roridomyces roridus TaxID=1738132 RepID=A0AAD7FAI8_9AGAR|nr:hypothetical protein FB45DRAFT_1039152 [Roridomyces roridus]
MNRITSKIENEGRDCNTSPDFLPCFLAFLLISRRPSFELVSSAESESLAQTAATDVLGSSDVHEHWRTSETPLRAKERSRWMSIMIWPGNDGYGRFLIHEGCGPAIFISLKSLEELSNVHVGVVPAFLLLCYLTYAGREPYDRALKYCTSRRIPAATGVSGTTDTYD